ncbi:MAG: class I SAM-dependent methyltransferase [Phycisphaerae bacterium]|jgi:SAM-dependent methyltransferase|nr:class I SAM-dependent methyltransferase [Phycisphaerae bacterium]
MDDSIFAVCDTVAGDSGFQFLQYMRDVYLGRQVSDLTAEEADEIGHKARELGLVVPKGGGRSDMMGLALSASGYLVGNISKEYCNWVDNGRVMPPPRPSEEWIAGRDVLDLGCSIGRWLWEFKPYARSVRGLEIRKEYIEIGKVLAQREKMTPPQVFHGCMEELDHLFPPESTDFIFCRLVINHVSIRKAIRNMIALLRRGGVLWLVVESFGCGWGKLCKNGGIKGRVFGGFGVVNSLVCELTGRQLNFRYRGRHQSAHRVAYPSRRWWKSTFEAMGIEGHIIEASDETFCIWGRKE